MLPAISDIKIRRKQLGITQTDLAQQTSVSQSLIAKIESESVVPSYANAKKLFDYLDSLEQKNQLSAQDLMTPKVLVVQERDLVRKAVRVMKNHSVSQLPVLQNGTVVGTVDEKDVLAQLSQTPNPLDFGTMHVDAIMAEALPQINPQTPFRVVSALLEHHDAVLVMQKGKIRGILTKSDLLKVILNKKRRIITL